MAENRRQRRARAKQGQHEVQKAPSPMSERPVVQMRASMRKEDVPELLMAIGTLIRDLDDANAGHEADRTHREPILISLAVVINFLKAPIIGQGKNTAALKLLFDQLADLDNGRAGPLVAPTSFGGAKPPLATAAWKTRAFLVAAVELRYELGDQLDAAAARVLRDAPRAAKVLSTGEPSADMVDHDAVAQLLLLRKKFRSKSLPGPPEGDHLVAWNTCLKLIASSRGTPDRSKVLEQTHCRFLKMAEDQATGLLRGA